MTPNDLYQTPGFYYGTPNPSTMGAYSIFA